MCTLIAVIIMVNSPGEIMKTDLDGRTYSIENLNANWTQTFTPPQQMPNWPKTIGVNPYYAPSGVNLADVDNDGDIEIIVGSTNNQVYVWDCQGNLMPGWPVTVGGMVQAKVAVGDIDNNGDKEIVIAARNGYVYVYNHDGTSYPNWPQNANGVLGFIAPVLFDLDQDGDLEILMAQMQSGQPGHVYVWHHNGSVHPGWPQNTDYLAVASVAVADIDNDNLFEIVCLSYRSVYVWDQNGNTEPGWPKLNVAGGMSYAQPVLADLDNDSDLEILHSYYTNAVNYVNIYHHDGTNFANWPQTFPGPQTYTMPVVGDIDSDSDLEIFGGGHIMGAPNLLARHHNGTSVSGWPVNCEMLECSPIVFDVDNDNVREVLVADNLNPGNFYAYEGNGSLVTDWPIATTAAAIVNSPSVGDVDLDGDIEIALLTSDGTVNLWTISDIPYRGYYTDWGTYYHDQWNTGWFHPRAPQNLMATGITDHIHLVWLKNLEPDIAGYNLYRSQTSGGPYTRTNTTLITDTTYDDYNVSPGITYYYCATAQVKPFAESRLSNETQAQLGIEEQNQKGISDLEITPNPFTKMLRIHGDKKMEIRIFDTQGRLITSMNGERNIIWQPEINVKCGVYFVEVKTNNENRIQKVVKIE
ncbi:MAG: T9SS type A sorting domain-containing protein [candidate division WOR-3 bacterium]